MTDALIAARLIHFASVMVLFGGSLFALYALRADAAAERHMPPRRWMFVVAGLLALLSALAWLATVIANMTGDWMDIADPEVVRSALFETAFGQIWLGRMALTLVLLALACFRSSTASWTGRRLFVLLAALLLGSLALTGHAAAHKGPWGDVHRADQALHLLGAGAWLGGLAPLAAVLGLARRTGSEAAVGWAGTVVHRFSRMGYWAVGLIFVTGALNSIFLVGSPAAILPTQYGKVLLAKVALVLVMVGVAAVNRFTLAPRLAGPAATRPITALWRNVMAELALGLAVLALVSLLGTLVPAMYHGG